MEKAFVFSIAASGDLVYNDRQKNAFGTGRFDQTTHERQEIPMKRRIVASLLSLIVLLALTPAFADGEFRITSIEPKENGNVMIRWSDSSNNGPYLVAYQYVSGDDAFSYQVEARDVREKQYEIIDLAPGERYCIYVFNKDYDYAYEEYSSETQQFGGRNSTARLTVTLRQKRNGSVSTVDRFSVSDIERTLSGGGDFCGATIKATMPQVTKGIKGIVRVAIKQPDGDMFVFMVQNESINSNVEYFYYDSVPFTEVWRYLKQLNGDEILAGTYTVSFYFNTDYFGYKDFSVVK